MNPESKKQVLKIVGGRNASTPEWLHKTLGRWPTCAHAWPLRVPDGLITWYEVWCNNESVIHAMNTEAAEIAARGNRCAFLPTRFSVRDVGNRRPLLVVPYDSKVDLKRIALLLDEAGYIGPKWED